LEYDHGQPAEPSSRQGTAGQNTAGTAAPAATATAAERAAEEESTTGFHEEPAAALMQPGARARVAGSGPAAAGRFNPESAAPRSP